MHLLVARVLLLSFTIVQASRTPIEAELSGGGPVLRNYNASAPRDTFELCRERANVVGSREAVPLQHLLNAYGLPRALARRRRISIAQLLAMLAHAAPDSATVVPQPMLFGEAELGQLLLPSTNEALPQLVHITVPDKGALRAHQALAVVSWAVLNPGHVVLLYDDADVAAFVRSYFPGLRGTFDALHSPVERSDLWRYAVLCALGGVYADSDVVAARPVRQWATDAELLVGVENAFASDAAARARDYARRVQLVQWVMAARRGHPVLCGMGARIAERVAAEAAGAVAPDSNEDRAVLQRTGPGAWTAGVAAHIAPAQLDDLVAGGVAGDVRVLPQPVFGCGVATFDASDPLPYAYHTFAGSWKHQVATERRGGSGRWLLLGVVGVIVAGIGSVLLRLPAATTRPARL